MYQTALKAYDTVNKSTMSGRDVEAEVLTKAATLSTLKLYTQQSTMSGRDVEAEV